RSSLKDEPHRFFPVRFSFSALLAWRSGRRSAFPLLRVLIVAVRTRFLVILLRGTIRRRAFLRLRVRLPAVVVRSLALLVRRLLVIARVVAALLDTVSGLVAPVAPATIAPVAPLARVPNVSAVARVPSVLHGTLLILGLHASVTHVAPVHAAR